MANPKFFRFPFASTGDKEAIPDEAQSSGALSYAEGFGLDYERDPTTDAKAKRMPRDGTNQVLYDATSNIQQYQLHGVPFWYDGASNGGTAIEYKKNAIVRYSIDGISENVYISLKDNNTDLPTVETSWFLFAPYDATLLSRLSVAPFVPVTSMTQTTPPSTPTTGKLYLVPANATGVWANKNNQIAEWNGKTWHFTATNEGHSIGLPDGRVFIKTNGTYVEKIALDAQSNKWLYAEASGTANALTATLTPSPQALNVGMAVRLKIKTANTEPATLNINGLGTKPIIYHETGEQLIGGDFQAGDVIALIYDGTNWRLRPSVAYLNSRNQDELDNSKNVLRADRIQIYDVAGTFEWTVPDNVYMVDVDLWGAGGGGGGSYGIGAAGSGGGGGAYARLVSYPVTPKSKIYITVGRGGTGGGGEPANGKSGGASSFGSVVTAGGGNYGGAAANSVNRSSAPGGVISGKSDVAVNGGESGHGVNTGGFVAGGVGGHAYGGSYTPLVVGGTGWHGIGIGGGGGGGANGNGGGSGHDGKVILRY